MLHARKPRVVLALGAVVLCCALSGCAVFDRSGTASDGSSGPGAAHAGLRCRAKPVCPVWYGYFPTCWHPWIEPAGRLAKQADLEACPEPLPGPPQSPFSEERAKSEVIPLPQDNLPAAESTPPLPPGDKPAAPLPPGDKPAAPAPGEAAGKTSASAVDSNP